jgi:hypothetical protein
LGFFALPFAAALGGGSAIATGPSVGAVDVPGSFTASAGDVAASGAVVCGELGAVELGGVAVELGAVAGELGALGALGVELGGIAVALGELGAVCGAVAGELGDAGVSVG